MLCELEAKNKILLFQTQVCWLSKGIKLGHLWEIKREAALFIEYGRKEQLLEAFKNVKFSSIWHLSVIWNSELTEIEVPRDDHHHYKLWLSSSFYGKTVTMEPAKFIWGISHFFHNSMKMSRIRVLRMIWMKALNLISSVSMINSRDTFETQCQKILFANWWKIISPLKLSSCQRPSKKSFWN